MGLFIFTLLTLVSISYECSIDPPNNCPSLSTRTLSLPALPKIQAYFLNREPPTETIRGIPLLTHPTPFLVRVTLLNSTEYNRNQLGFFTLPPKVGLPKSPDSSLNMSIIFSDIKRPCTESGDALNIGFSEGTQVGFYLITDGWCGGISKQWSVPQYNEDSKPMTAVFFDPSTNTLVIGIEDTPTRKHVNFQDVVFEVETKPPLNLTWFEGSIAIACSTPCPDCNFTTGKCVSENENSTPQRVRNNSYIRRSVLMGVLIILGLLLAVAVVVILYFVWQKTKFNQLLAGGWLPVMPGAFVDEEEKSEEAKDDLEEGLKDDDL